jgi:L-aminopeptidase/D-esterase-like protein
VLTDVAGVRVGHWTDTIARTGCTVALFPAGTVASGEVRGGAPGTREWELLNPARLVARVDAVVLCGGSAFGLAACDGVMRWCEERGVGLPTAGGPVPIVVGAVLFDLGVGDATVRPGPDQGYLACEAAVAAAFDIGAVGAGTGATVGKWRGPEGARPGGLGTATCRGPDGLIVAALVACNAWGDVRGDVRGASGPVARGSPLGGPLGAGEQGPPWGLELGNTTIGVIATNARLDKSACLLVAQSGHDGMARALSPVHAAVDGDALVAAATGTVALTEGPVGVEVVRALAAEAVEAAIRAAVPSTGGA